MRSHPPTLLTLARRSIERHRLFGAGDRVLVAVSGGPDSMGLLSVLARLAPTLRFELAAAGVDHGLRPEAGRELELARGFAEHLGVPFAILRVEVARGGNLQARARDARLCALRAERERLAASCLATAHHLEDRAETVLIRLVSGSGARGLGCLPPRDGDLVRPLLDATRADIDAHLARHHVPSSRDPSNRDRRFLRTRVREDILPLLVRENPNLCAHLSRLADELRALHEARERAGEADTVDRRPA